MESVCHACCLLLTADLFYLSELLSLVGDIHEALDAVTMLETMFPILLNG